MGVIDIILVACFLPCIWFGLKRGLVRQIVSICVIYFGITLSLKFSGQLSSWLSNYIPESPFAVKLISFILIFFAIALALSLLGKVVEKILKISLLGWINRLLGLVLAFFVFLFAISSAVFLIDSANSLVEFIPKDSIAESRIYPALLDFSKFVFPYFKELF